jgi:hypothetical protein
MQFLREALKLHSKLRIRLNSYPLSNAGVTGDLNMTTVDRRGPKRRRVLKGATISVRGLGTSTDCRVRDLSESGACLVITSSVGIPDAFDLVFSDGGVKRCQVEWRLAGKIGVSFA